MTAPYTRLGLDGYGVRRVGSFAGKAATAQPVATVASGGWTRRGRKRWRALNGAWLDQLAEVRNDVAEKVKAARRGAVEAPEPPPAAEPVSAEVIAFAPPAPPVEPAPAIEPAAIEIEIGPPEPVEEAPVEIEVEPVEPDPDLEEKDEEPPPDEIAAPAEPEPAPPESPAVAELEARLAEMMARHEEAEAQRGSAIAEREARIAALEEEIDEMDAILTTLLIAA